MRTPQLDADAPWRRRFRAPTNIPQVARANPARGLVASNRSGVFQLYAWDVATGALAQLTDAPAGKQEGFIAPDGRFAYFFDDRGGDEIGRWVRVPLGGGAPEDLTPGTPPYASWSFGLALGGARAGLTLADDEGFHVLTIDLGPGGAIGGRREIFRSAKMASGPQLSADGALAVVESAERSEMPQFSLLAIDAATGERLGELWDGAGTSVTASGFSPLPGDARVLAVSDRTGAKRPLIWDARTGERRDLDLGGLGGEVEAWDWSPDGRAVLLCHTASAARRLYRFDLEEGRLRRLDHPGGTVLRAAFTPDGEIVAQWSDSAHPPQALALDAETGAVRRALFGAGDVPPGRPWRSVSFPSADGTAIQAWLATPEGDGPFPTVIDIHGGPGVTFDAWDAGSQMWLDHGVAFMAVNYRGSTTFGKAFEEAIYRDLGRLEVEDLAAARAWLVREGVARPDAVLLTGWSYGGYLVLMGLGVRPELWAGGVAGIAIADWAVQWEDTSATLRGYQEAIFGGTPAERPEQYARSSPITYADRVRAPVLIIQGANDTRCPPRPVIHYEERLRSLGGDIEVAWFDAGHGTNDVDTEVGHYERMLRFAHRALG